MHSIENDLIQYFRKLPQIQRGDVVLGIGDDAAVLSPPQNQALIVSTDTFNADVHFPSFLYPRDIAYRCVMASLSDLAACGAESTWLLLSLTLPEGNADWVQDFADGFSEVLNQTQTQCVGGDMTQGPLAITLQVMGVAPSGAALTRAGAKIGDDIYVSGELGAAALGIELFIEKVQSTDAALSSAAKQAWLKPCAQLSLGKALRGLATSAIDLSDGLMTDATHLCEASQVSAEINLSRCPIAKVVQQFCEGDETRAAQYALSGGEDYQLCFTASPDSANNVFAAAETAGVVVTKIGTIKPSETSHQTHVFNSKGESIELPSGYQHF